MRRRQAFLVLWLLELVSSYTIGGYIENRHRPFPVEIPGKGGVCSEERQASEHTRDVTWLRVIATGGGDGGDGDASSAEKGSRSISLPRLADTHTPPEAEQ